jgi:hypothetical protein
MNRIPLFAALLLMSACGGGGGGGSVGVQQTSAETVGSSSSDFPSLQKCPESGTWDHYLTAEQAKNPSQYSTDKSDLDTLKAAGANDTYVAVYADTSSGCGSFGADTPTGKVADVYAIRFKDASAASANYKVNLKDFHLSDSDLANIKTAGGIVTNGAASGLGDNSVVVSFSIGGVSFYAAFWQKNQFEVALIDFNVPEADSKKATTNIDGRMK